MTGNVENVALRALNTISQRMVIDNHLIADSKLISVHERCHLVESPTPESADGEGPVGCMPCGQSSVANPVEFSRRPLIFT